MNSSLDKRSTVHCYFAVFIKLLLQLDGFYRYVMNIFDPLSVKSTHCGMPALPSITAMLEARMQHQHRGAQRISTYLHLILNIKGFDQPKPHLFLCCHICKHLQTSSVQKC